MDFEAQTRKRMEALEEKRKRLEEMRKARHEKKAVNEGMSATFSDLSKSIEVKSETDALVNKILDMPETESRPKLPGSGFLQQSLKRGELTRVTANFKLHMMPAEKVAFDKSAQVEDYELEPSDQVEKDQETQSLSDPDDREEETGTQTKEEEEKVAVTEMKASYTPLTTVEYTKVVSQPIFKDFLKRSALLVDRALDETDSSDIIKDYAAKQEIRTKSKTFKIFPPYEVEALLNRPVMDIKWSELVPDMFLVAYGEKSVKRVVVGFETKDYEESAGKVCIWMKDTCTAPEHKFSAPSPVLSAVFHSTDESLILGGCYSGQILLWDMRGDGHGKNKAPIQRSSMSGKGHKHPVYAMAMMNAAVSTELVSVSSDGLLCHWDVTRLQEPLLTAYLNYPSPQSLLPDFSALDMVDSLSKGPLNVCSMAFEQTETSTNILFGTGSGQVFRSVLPYRSTNPPINELHAHSGLVSAIQPHCSRLHNRQSLLLTCSLDWTVKLWNLSKMDSKMDANGAPIQVPIDTPSPIHKPMLEFNTPDYDYVTDVQWSPCNSAVFSTITSCGHLTLWNVAKSSTAPLDELNLTEEQALYRQNKAHLENPGLVLVSPPRNRKAKQQQTALNKSVWSRDGLSLLVGDSRGAVFCVGVNKAQVESGKLETEWVDTVLVKKVLKESDRRRGRTTGMNNTRI